MTRRIVAHVIGGCVWDERLIVDKLQQGESVPMQSHMQLGGVARNVAFAMAGAQKEIDLKTHFIRGDDETGQAMDRQLQLLNFGPAQAIKGQSTARYMSIEDGTGKVLYGLADMDLFEHFPIPENLDGDVLITDTNPSEDFFEALEVEIPFYVVATSPHKILRAKTSLHKMTGLFLNKQEAISLVGKDQPMDKLAKCLAALGPSKILITQGGEAPAVYEDGVFNFADTPKSLPKNHSHNGLGDRLGGLTLAHLISEKTSLKDATNRSLKLLGNPV